MFCDQYHRLNMERIKRSLDESIEDYDHNNNKKQKFENEVIPIHSNKFVSCFENLPNETIYEIFEYLDLFHIYKSFYHLNNRYKNLILHSNSFIQINVSTISKSDFDDYHQHMIKPNLHRINYLHLSNPFTIDLIFSPPRLIIDLSQLQTLILDNIHTKYFDNLLKHFIHLPRLIRLNLSLIEYASSPGMIFAQIFQIKTLKSCQLTFQTRYTFDFYFNKPIQSSIENLVINTNLHCDSLHEILTCLPQLQHLTVNKLMGANSSAPFYSSMVLKNLKSIHLTVDSLNFYCFSQLMKKYFHNIESLSLSILNDSSYMTANSWEDLIKNSLPNLHTFDFQHEESVATEYSVHHFSLMAFKFTFWSNRNWYFSQQHETISKYYNGMFYSVKPYRRNDYKLYRQPDTRLSTNEFHSVEHLYICQKEALKNFHGYFPNVTELTINEPIQIRDNTRLDHVLPLEQIKKLSIEPSQYQIEQIFKLVNLLPNLETLKINAYNMHEVNLFFDQQKDFLVNLSKTNRVKYLELPLNFSLHNIQLLTDLFPSVECLKIGLYRKDRLLMIKCLLTNLNCLFSLCLKQAPKVCLREINYFIHKEKLLENYSIKLIERDLYIWW